MESKSSLKIMNAPFQKRFGILHTTFQIKLTHSVFSSFHIETTCLVQPLTSKLETSGLPGWYRG